MNRSNILGWAPIGGLLAILALMPATASIFGDLLKANIYSNGGNVTLGQNSTAATGNIRVEDLVVEDDSTLTDDVAIGGDLTVTGATILTGGIATGTVTNLTATTATITNAIVAGFEIIGIFRYAADPNATTATLTATGTKAGDYVLSGAPTTANGTFKALTGAAPGTNTIGLTWEVDPGTTITQSFMVLRAQ